MDKTTDAINKLKAFRDYTLKNIDEDEKLNGSEISRMIVKAAAYMSILGEEVAVATRESNASYAFRKFRTAQEFKRIRDEMDKSIGDAKEEALELVHEMKEVEIQKQYDADLLKTFYDDISRLIMTLQSRLKVIERQHNLDSKAT